MKSAREPPFAARITAHSRRFHGQASPAPACGTPSETGAGSGREPRQSVHDRALTPDVGRTKNPKVFTEVRL